MNLFWSKIDTVDYYTRVQHEEALKMWSTLIRAMAARKRAEELDKAPMTEEEALRQAAAEGLTLVRSDESRTGYKSVYHNSRNKSNAKSRKVCTKNSHANSKSWKPTGKRNTGQNQELGVEYDGKSSILERRGRARGVTRGPWDSQCWH